MVTINCVHCTKSTLVHNIKEKGFILGEHNPNSKPVINLWLGDGVYFWNSSTSYKPLAFSLVKKKYKCSDVSEIHLVVQAENFIDLDEEYSILLSYIDLQISSIVERRDEFINEMGIDKIVYYRILSKYKRYKNVLKIYFHKKIVFEQIHGKKLGDFVNFFVDEKRRISGIIIDMVCGNFFLKPNFDPLPQICCRSVELIPPKDKWVVVTV